jgi:hypothetical protein
MLSLTRINNSEETISNPNPDNEEDRRSILYIEEKRIEIIYIVKQSFIQIRQYDQTQKEWIRKNKRNNAIKWIY